MTIFHRLYRVLRAQIDAGQQVEWPEVERSAEPPPAPPPDFDAQLAGYYANLEIPYGADRETAQRAWKRLLKKYHPDLHASDPEKRRVANELTAELTKAYRAIEHACKNKEKS